MATKKTITRRWVGSGTNDKVETYSEQRYISKHSRSFLQGVKDNANWKLYCQLFSKAFTAIAKDIDNGNLDNTLINSTGIFTTIHTNKSISLQHLPEKSFFYVRRKCLDGALLLLSGNPHLGATAPKEDAARQTIQDLLAWANIVLGTQEDNDNSDSNVEDDASESKDSSTKSAKNQHKEITELSAVISIDFEWQLSDHNEVKTTTGEVLKHSTERRSFGDVLSCQFVIYLPDYPSCSMYGIIFNDSPMGFNFRALMLKFTDVIQKEFHALDNNHQPIILNLKKLKLLLTGYYLGVDLSCMTAWNKLPLKLVVLGKHRIFTRLPYKFQLRRRQNDDPVTVTMTIRDTASIAPPGGLKKLGEMVNQPKIDVTKQDAIDFALHKISLTDYCHYLNDGGYYKNNMKVLQKRHFKLYCDYALNDSVVAMKYLQMFMKTFGIAWSNFRNVPITTTNHALQGVANALKNDCLNQRIFDPEIKFADVRINPINACRDNYRDLFAYSTNSYFGGFNTAFCSVIIPSCVVVDTDLTSAYVLAAALMARPDYSKNRKSNTLDYLFDCLTSLDNASGISFEQLYQVLKQKADGFPFILGSIKADIDYPDDYDGIILTPQRSPKTDNPVYTRHLKDKCVTIIDAIDAYQHGAAVTLHSAEIPAQDWRHYNAWADVQLNFLSLRQAAKRKRDIYDKGSVEYKKYDAEQLMYKLCCNTIYGASAQAVLPKNTRDYETNQTETIGISRVTDPVIAGTYTAITRYLAHNLYDSVACVYKSDVLSLNITTDGYTFALPSGFKFDNSAVNKVFSSRLPDYYMKRLKANNFTAGFERKGDTSDVATTVFNVRTRLNGTPYIKSLDALGGIQDMSVQQVMNVIKSGQPTLVNHAKRFSNLTSMKFANDRRANHHSGILFEWRQNINIPLQYDCAYKPNEWIDSKWNGFGFTCIPFDTVEQHDEWKEHSKLLTDRWNITLSKERFQTYLLTMKDYSFSRTDKTLDSADYHARVKYVLDRLAGISTESIREFKNTLYSTKQAIKLGRKLPICRLAVYDNWKLKGDDADE